jgi:AraC-like DNA-binding protein
MNFLISDGYKKTTKDIKKTKERFDYWQSMISEEFVELDFETPPEKPFQGEIKGGVFLEKLRFSEVIATPQTVKRKKSQINRNSEEEFLLSFQLDNVGVVRQNGREAILTPGTFALYDSTEPYSLSFKDSFHQIVIQIPKDVLRQELVHPERYTAVKMSGHAGMGAILTNFVFSLAKEFHCINHELLGLSDNLNNMIAMTFSTGNALKKADKNSLVKKSLIERVYRYIDNNLLSPSLTNNSIAASQNISTRYLNKIFESEEESIHNIIMNKRLEKALNLLKCKDYKYHSVESISFSVGFSSAAHFSRVFKKRFNFNPSEIRGKK